MSESINNSPVIEVDRRRRLNLRHAVLMGTSMVTLAAGSLIASSSSAGRETSGQSRSLASAEARPKAPSGTSETTTVPTTAVPETTTTTTLAPKLPSAVSAAATPKVEAAPSTTATTAPAAETPAIVSANTVVNTGTWGGEWLVGQPGQYVDITTTLIVASDPGCYGGRKTAVANFVEIGGDNPSSGLLQAGETEVCSNGSTSFGFWVQDGNNEMNVPISANPGDSIMLSAIRLYGSDYQVSIHNQTNQQNYTTSFNDPAISADSVGCNSEYMGTGAAGSFFSGADLPSNPTEFDYCVANGSTDIASDPSVQTNNIGAYNATTGLFERSAAQANGDYGFDVYYSASPH